MSAALTALGVAASATQLVAYGKSIISFIGELYDRIQDAPKEYREYELQLKLLVNIAGEIEQNSALQSTEVQCHLDSTLAEIKALQSILCCPTSGFANSSFTQKYWGLIKGSEQRKILAHLKNLHQKNTRLLLCISTVNTAQLSGVQGSIDKLINRNVESFQQGFSKVEEKDIDLQAIQSDIIQERRLVLRERKSLNKMQAKNQRELAQPDCQDMASARSADGSHYRGITIGGGSSLTCGNTNNGQSDGILSKRHYFGDIVAGDNTKAHLGNTGLGLDGHTFESFHFGVSSLLHIGDFNHVDTKKEQWTELKKNKEEGQKEEGEEKDKRHNG